MIGTDKEKERQALIEARRERARGYQARSSQGQQANPLYGKSAFEPSAYLPTVPSDPALSQPLPSGRFIDSKYPSGASVARATDIKEFRENPDKYVKENISQLNNEQSLVEKGATMLGRLFNYNDEADLQIFGVNLSAVESVWDNFTRYYTGAFDLLSIGFGGLISAAPGGVQTLSYDQLSGGKSVGDVLSGKMEPGSAPSPGQIAIASVALEAKRIREGNARLSDVLLMNPATAPFILAALAAETSPLQKDGFNIMDKEQRDTAFGSGYEQWMSGVTDAGLMFADPLIAAGVALKITRAGMLGRPGGLKYGQNIKGANQTDLAELEKIAPGSTGQQRLEDIIARGQELTPQVPDAQPILKNIANDANYQAPVPQSVLEQVVPITKDTPMPEGPLARFYYRLHMVDENGNRKMTYDNLVLDKNIEKLADPASVASVLMKTTSPAESALMVEVLSGTAGAVERLDALSPGLADMAVRFRREQYAAMGDGEPAKRKEIVDGLNSQIENTTQEINSITEQIRLAGGDTGTLTDPDAFKNVMGLKNRQATLQQNINEMTELVEVASNRKTFDALNPDSAFYRPDQADRIVNDLFSTQDAVTRAVKAQIQDAAQVTRTFFPSTNNVYSRTVTKSRERRTKAAFEYSQEKTSFFPHKRPAIDDVTGKTILVSDGWFSPSTFEGTSRIQRQMRVWRWMGTENPAGYVGLNGTSTVGSEREFRAAVNTQLYSGEEKIITRKLFNEDGTPLLVRKEGKGAQPLVQATEEVIIGGTKGRDQLFRTFYEALNNPDVDTLQVVKQLEDKMMSDFATFYGLDAEKMKGILQRADNAREKNLELIRGQSYFVDPITGAMQHVPYLDSQLANGTYMHNFKAVEDILIKQFQKDNGESLKRAFDVPAHMAGSAYEMFNNFWRPATLLRLSYTQRNVFEGLIRAMAFSGSVAPLLWPVKAASFGLQNKVVSKNISRRINVAAKNIKDSEFNGYLQEYNIASSEEYYLRAAIRNVAEGDSEPMRYMAKPDGTFDRLTEEQWADKLDKAMNRTTDAMSNIKNNEQKFTESVQGTAFGKWREKNIKDLQQEEVSLFHSLAIIQNDAMDAMKVGDVVLDDAALAKVSELVRSSSIIRMQLDDLRYNPTKATALYRGQAGRQRRIGSGKSMGPDGNYHNDGFAGPLATINAGLMSSDNTVMQTLSLKSDVWSSAFFKTIIRNNQAIEFSEKSLPEWSEGLAQTIEEASSSYLVRTLVKYGWDEEKVLQELMGSKQGEQFLIRTSGLMGDFSLEDVAKTADDYVPNAYYGPIGSDGTVAINKREGFLAFSNTPSEASRLPSGQRLSGITDVDQARLFINEVSNQVKTQMQSRREFMDLLEDRVRQKTGASGFDSGSVSAKQIKDIVDLMPEDQKAKLGYVQGAEIVQMGADGFLGVWAGLANKMFRLLGTIPEDYITRGGFYNMRYKSARNTLMSTYLERTGQSNVIKKGKSARSSSNRVQGMTVDHDEFKISAGELSRIEVQAHRMALKDTREWMYTIERRTNVGKYGEWIYPFISATQNSATVIGKLLYKEPWLAPMVTDLWRMPTRLGVEDEEGNVLIPMPLEWVRKTLADNPSIPFLGGVVDSADELRIPKGGLNLFMPETGFGIAPRPTPWVQVAASELMKANLFPVETPQILRNSLGDTAGDDFYQAFKDYVFGEEQGASSTFLSLDKITPAYIQKIFQSKDELSTQYGYQYSLHYHTQMMRWMANEREDRPTENEIAKRTTNSFWFAALGNQGIPTPLTPYPILTRPQVDSPLTALQDVYKQFQQADALNANLNMDRMFGDYGLAAANTKVSQNVGGADPTPSTVSDINTLAPLIRSISPDLGDTDLNVLGILINNRRSPETYEQSAYSWQKSGTIPGTNRNWRETQSPEQAVAERQKLTGWTVYRKAIDQLDAQLKSAGFTSYELKGAASFKKARQVLVNNMMSNPDYAGWVVDYQDRGGIKTQSAVKVIEAGIQDPNFQNLLTSSGKERLLGIMNEYTSTRRLLIDVLKKSGHSIDHDSNAKWKIGWDAIRVKWRNEDERWAEIDSLYLSGDDNPQSPGNLYLQELAGQEMQGAQ